MYAEFKNRYSTPFLITVLLLKSLQILEFLHSNYTEKLRVQRIHPQSLETSTPVNILITSRKSPAVITAGRPEGKPPIARKVRFAPSGKNIIETSPEKNVGDVA